MNRPAARRPFLRQALLKVGVAAFLLLLGGLALAGPYGLLEWGKQRALLEKREARIAGLEDDRTELKNRVELLDPDNVDPDFSSELVRRDLKVAHPDEYIVELEPQD